MSEDRTRPIFVVGFQRSGTTLLQSLIGAHPRIAGPPELYFLFRMAKLASYYGDLADDDNLKRAVRDALHPPVDLLAGSSFDDDHVFERAARKPRTMRGLLEAIMEDFAERQGKARWSEKSPGQTVRAILKLVPDAKIVHIVRDPRDVIASSLKTPWTQDGAYRLALRWRSVTATNVRWGLHAGPDSFLQIRYEDLTRDPLSVLTLVFTFLGEGFDPSVLTASERRRSAISAPGEHWQRRVLDDVAPAVEGSWKTQLQRRERLVVGAVLAPWIAALGYEPTPRSTRLLGTAIAALPAASTRLADRRMSRHPRTVETSIRDYLDEQARAMSSRESP